MLPVVLVASLFIGSALGSPLANQYIESVLNTALRNEISSLHLDPATVPGFNTDFEVKVPVFGKVKGRAEYSKGTFSGLSQVRRYSECQGPFYGNGAKSVNCTIALDNIKLNYEGKLKYGKMPKVSIQGKANVSTTLIFVEVSSPVQNFHANVKRFLLTQIGKLDIKFTGLGPLNKYTKFLEDGYRSYAQAELFNSMSQKFLTALNRAFNQVQTPF